MKIPLIATFLLASLTSIFIDIQEIVIGKYTKIKEEITNELVLTLENKEFEVIDYSGYSIVVQIRKEKDNGNNGKTE